MDSKNLGVHCSLGAKEGCWSFSGCWVPQHPDERDVGRVLQDVGGSFGYGIHSCVGMHVARAEAEAFLSAFARNVEHVELAGKPVWRPNNAVQLLAKLPLNLTPK